MRIVLLVFGVIAFLFVVTMVFGSWYTVDQGFVGVITRNGAVVGTAQPGFNFKTPWIEDVTEVQTRQQKWTQDKIEAYSRDLQPANLRITINYHVDGKDAMDLYGRYGTGYADTILTPAVLSSVKIVFGRFDAPTAIANRAEMVKEMQLGVQAAITSPDIVIDALQLENVSFSEQFMQAVEQRMQAEVEVQKFKQTLAREQVQADIVRTQASATADQTRFVAKANADAVNYSAAADANRIRLVGQASADAIKARAEALKNNPLLIDLTAVEKWGGNLPTTMLPGSVVPFLGLHTQPAVPSP